MSKTFGLQHNLDAASDDPVKCVRQLTEGRGADAVVLAVAGNSLVRPAIDAARPGGRVMLFAQTQHSEVSIDPAAVCVDEKTLLGSYSASVDLQEENVRLVFSREIDFARLITHRFVLAQAVEALHLAAHPGPDSLKVVIQPGMEWENSK
jgi:L-iditol 2-dehydrogenase